MRGGKRGASSLDVFAECGSVSRSQSPEDLSRDAPASGLIWWNEAGRGSRTKPD